MSNTINHPAFSPKDSTEEILLAFDFTAVAATLAAPVVTIARHSGSRDTVAGAMLSGPASVSGSKVVQKITGGVDGASYVLRCEAEGPDGSRYVLAGVLPVRTA